MEKLAKENEDERGKIDAERHELIDHQVTLKNTFWKNLYSLILRILIYKLVM